MQNNNNNDNDDNRSTGDSTQASAEKLNPSHPGVLISRLDDTLEPWQWSHRAELEEVKKRSNISHNLLDQWIWKFLENKHFNVNETVAKLERRLTMERNELGTIDVTDLMRDTMKSGVVQFLGEDRAGRIALYFVTSRDFPKSKHRHMRTQNFDMWLSCACRIRARDARCGITMLINQTDASFWSNTDMTFQSNIALRIAKYYPGVIEKAYVCNMATALSTIAKPVLSAFPKAISDHIFVISKEEVKNGKLLEYFDESVLPVVMGGKNSNVDSQSNFQHFADTVEDHYKIIKDVIQSGKSLKEWEMEQALEECSKIEEEEKRKFRAAAEEVQNASLLAIAADQSVNNGGIGLEGSLNARRSHRKRLSNESRESGQNARFASSHSPDFHYQDQNVNNNNSSHHHTLLFDDKGNPLPKSSHHHQHYYDANNNNEDYSDLDTCASSEDLDALIDEYYEKHGDEILDDEDERARNDEDDNNHGEDGNNNTQRKKKQQQQRIVSRKNQKRLFALQRRRVVRDEGYFRSTMYELYEHQLRTLSEYYEQKTQEYFSYYDDLYDDDNGGYNSSDSDLSGNGDSDEEMMNVVSSSSPTGQQRQKNRRRTIMRRRRSILGSPATPNNNSNNNNNAEARHRFSALATICPKSFQGFALGFLLMLFAGFAAFFFMATLFYLMGAAAIVVTMFLYIFSSPSNIFPMSLGILLVSHQGALIASRGFELATQCLKGELLLPLRWLSRKLGKRYGVGLILQFLLFFSIALAQLATFIVAAVADPILGLQQLFAIGLYSSGVIIMLVHSFFPFGLDDEQSSSQLTARSRSDNSRIGLSVYFFFDITENLDAEQTTYDASGQQKDTLGGNLPTSSLVLAIFPALLSFVLGVSFTIEQNAFFLISSIAVTLGAGFTLTHFIAGKLKTLTANLSRSAIWVGVLVWMFFFFALGLVPGARDTDAAEHQDWMGATVGLMVVWGVLAFLTSAAQRVDEATSYHRFFFRSAYTLLAIGTMAGIVTLFTTHWVLGMFAILFLFHSVACFYRPSSHSPTATLVLSITICLVLVAIILFATNSGSNDFDVSDLAVLRNGNFSSLNESDEPTLFSSSYKSNSIQNNYRSESFSLCQRVWNLKSSNINLRLPDFAFFVKLSYARQLSGEKFQNFLPQWTLKAHSQGVSGNIEKDESGVEIDTLLYDVFADPKNNTVIAVRTDSALLSQIKVVSMWTEAISLLPFVTIFPIDWTASIIGGVSDVTDLFDPFPVNLINQLQSQVSSLIQEQKDYYASINDTTSNPEFLVTGHSVGGSVAAAVASRLGLRAVTFSSPGLHYSRVKFKIDETSYERYVLNIRTTNDAVSVVDTYGPNQQDLDCKDGVATCSSINFPLCTLADLCSTSANISLTGC